MEWISVKYRLPEPREDVNVKLVDGTIVNNVFRGFYVDVFWIYDDLPPIPFEDVIEWQPLEQY